MKKSVTRLDYCQYLLVSQINYTLTNFADHCEEFSHDAINRYLRGERITSRLVWENVHGQGRDSVALVGLWQGEQNLSSMGFHHTAYGFVPLSMAEPSL